YVSFFCLSSSSPSRVWTLPSPSDVSSHAMLRFFGPLAGRAFIGRLDASSRLMMLRSYISEVCEFEGYLGIGYGRSITRERRLGRRIQLGKLIAMLLLLLFSRIYKSLYSDSKAFYILGRLKSYNIAISCIFAHL